MESRTAQVLASPESLGAANAPAKAPVIAASAAPAAPPTPVTPADAASTSSEPDNESAAEPAASLAEDLPALYRAILDRVAMLEGVGERDEAGRIRADATEAYSVAWNGSARSRLTNLLVRADRILEGRPRARGWTFRRRLARAR
jgi:hypothetical protein